MAKVLELTFTKLTLQKCGRDRKGGKAEFTADLSNKVVNAMGWTHPLDHETGVGLDGALACNSETILGLSGTLKDQHETRIMFTSISAFQATRKELKGKRGKGFMHQLSFKAKFSDSALADLEVYMSTVPEDKGTMKVFYTPQAVQSEITEVVATEEQRQAVLAEA